MPQGVAKADIGLLRPRSLTRTLIRRAKTFDRTATSATVVYVVDESGSGKIEATILHGDGGGGSLVFAGRDALQFARDVAASESGRFLIQHGDADRIVVEDDMIGMAVRAIAVHCEIEL